MTAPAGYKATEVGVIPTDWEIKPLAEVCRQIVDGTHFTPTYTRDGVPFYSVENVTANDFRNVKFISKKDYELQNKRCNPEKGDILMTRIGSLGDTRLIDWDVKASIYVSLALLKVGEDIDPLFLYAYSRSQIFRQAVENRSLMSAVPKKINMGAIGDVPVPVPPTNAEQAAIAEALSDVDEAIAAAEVVITKKRDLKTAMMQALLSGARRLPGFSQNSKLAQRRKAEFGEIPGDWDIATVSQVAKITTGSRNTQDRQADGQFPFFVRSQTIERINSYSFDGEAVLTAGDGVGTGKVFHYINGKFDCHQRVYIMSHFERVDGYFFFKVFSQKFYERIMSMTAKSSVDSVRREMIADMQIPIPPVPEQLAIANVLSGLDIDLDEHESKLIKLRHLKTGMMQQLFTGKIRLI